MNHRAAAILLISLILATPTGAADLTVGAQTTETLISSQLFKQNGRWYVLDNGPCYAYLENPQTDLNGGRLILHAHLSGRLGFRVGSYCAGSGFASNVALSGQLIGRSSTLTLGDIRIDHVDDSVTRSIVDLIWGTAPQLLPRALSIDVLALAHATPVTVTGVPVSLRQFHIDNIVTRGDAVIVTFDFSLSTP